MPTPPESLVGTLTGETRYRRGWFGKWILQVEDTAKIDLTIRLSPFVDRKRTALIWRDATDRDIQHLAARARLIAQQRKGSSHEDRNAIGEAIFPFAQI